MEKRHIAAGLACILLLMQAAPVPAAPRHHSRPKKAALSLTDRLTNALDAAAAEKVRRIRVVWRDMSNTTTESAPYARIGAATITVSRDIEKTSSLTTPYLGYVTVNVQVLMSEPFDTKAEAQAAAFTDTYRPGKKLTYAYQGGRWVFKSEEKLTTE